MNKTMLIAGKDFPDCSNFADGIMLSGRNVMVSAKSVREKENPSGMEKYATWNKSSPLSAHSLILQCENAFSCMDEAVFYFDEVQLCRQFQDFSVENCSRAVDELVLGYQYLTFEVISRFEKKGYGTGDRNPGKLVFLIRFCPSEYEAARSPGLKAKTDVVAGPIAAAAAAAFTAFAENIAVSRTTDSVQIVLIRCDEANEICRKETTLASWLCGHLDSLDEMKSRFSSKQTPVWIKAGAKGVTGLNLFFRTH